MRLEWELTGASCGELRAATDCSGVAGAERQECSTGEDMDAGSRPRACLGLPGSLLVLYLRLKGLPLPPLLLLLRMLLCCIGAR